MPEKVGAELERMKKAIKGKAVLITIPNMYIELIDAFIEQKRVSRSMFLWKSAMEKIRRVEQCTHPRAKNGDCPEIKCDGCKWKRKSHSRK